jgi:hypothetical protein
LRRQDPLFPNNEIVDFAVQALDSDLRRREMTSAALVRAFAKPAIFFAARCS